MRSNKKLGAVLAAVILGLMTVVALPSAATAHEDQDHGPQPAKKPVKKTAKKTKKVAIGFTAVNGNQPVSCSKPITGLGTTSRNAKLTDLRFYVSGVQLLRKGGGAVNVTLPKSKWSYTKGKSAVTLIDLENGAGDCATEGTKAMNALVKGTVPKGKYVGVRYSISVPQNLNHTDVTAVPAPLNSTAMAWSWQFGRKFTKIEISQDDGPAWSSKIFYVHVGSTDCKGNPAAGEKATCGLPNRNQVTLKKFDPAKQKIAIDFKKLFGGVNVAGADMGAMDGMDGSGGMDMEMSMNGCMSATTSPDCAPIFKSFGLKLGTTKRTNQTAFRVVRK